MNNVRHILLFLSGVFFIVCSCQGIPGSWEGREAAQDFSVAVDSGVVCLRVMPDDGPAGTKVAVSDAAAQEDAVQRWAYFVFENASPYKYVRRGICTSTSETFTLAANRSYRIRVIANYPVSGDNALDVHSVNTLGDYNALGSFLGDNAVGAFVMAGSTTSSSFTVQPTSWDGSNDITVRLKRLVAKVKVVSVRKAFTDVSKGAKPLVLRHVYMTNVYPHSRYYSDYDSFDLVPDCSLWYNYCGWHRSGSMEAVAVVDALVGERDLNVLLPQNQNVSVDRTLYFYPNPLLLADDERYDEAWPGARCTRIVFDCVYDGDESRGCYYTATLHMVDTDVPLARNYSYLVTCTFTDVGSLDPEFDIDPNVEVAFSYGVDWDSAYFVHEES